MHMIKRLFLVIAGLTLVLSTAGYATQAHGKAIAATQKTLVASQLPPLIPLESLGVSPAKWGYQLSDSGKWLAWQAKNKKKMVLRYQLTAGGKVHELSPKGRFFFKFYDPEKALYIIDNLGIWLVDPQNPSKKWYRIIPRGIKNWRIAFFPQPDHPYWFFYSYDKSLVAPDIYRYDPRGEHGERISKNDGSIFSWYFSPKGKVVIRYRHLKKGATAVEISKGHQWRRLLKINAKDTFVIAATPKPGKTIWALSNRGRDKIVAVSINPKTGKESVFYKNKQVDIALLRIDAKTNRPRSVTFANPDLTVVCFNEKCKKIQRLISDKKISNFSTLSKTTDDSKLIATLSENEGPQSDFLIDVKAGTRQLIKAGVLTPYREALSKTQPITIKARDGLMLPALLTLPKGVSKGTLPMVLLVRENPAFRDFWGSDRLYVQILANRGYAVLRVNFRGSIGYGHQFQAAGYGQIGRKMQDDLDDAVKWAIAKGIADPNNVAIMGANYGGYAALMAAWRGHGLYKAAVAYAPVSDMDFQTEDYPKHWLRYIGDPKKTKVQKRLQALLPVNHAKDFNIPVLLIHGTKDKIVNVQQTQLLEQALEESHKKAKVIYLEGAGHAIYRPANLLKYAQTIEAFLAQHIGGRREVLKAH